MLTKRPSKMKAQSAMEYLMTYGWAILIIAVVLGALFSIGVFSSSSFLGTGCVASSGYLCQNPVLLPGTVGSGQAGNNILTLTLGQNTGATAFCGFYSVAQQGASLNGFGFPVSASIVQNAVGTVTSGSTNTIAFIIPNTGGSPAWPSNTLGLTFTGTVWFNYSTTAPAVCTSANALVATKLGTIIVKVT